ncbi:MAG: BrnT family toxin [Prevotellaceae bacterium]|jgi:uncharacterized DUF497 family protein|nr:BrnT family toxin [Prevotellaceae bacterium]
MEFEWDENKREINLAKHDIDFADAVVVFDDPYKIEEIDNRKNYGEIRINTIGLFKNEVIVAVVNTNRNGIIRIISVRLASKKERRLYYGNR